MTAQGQSSATAAAVDFLGIGVQKAGTTWLHRMLGAHPDVFVAQGERKDTEFFSHHYDRGYEWYERFFAGSAAAKRRGEISTSYFYCRDAPERVRRYNPGMQLLLCLRNPVDRLESNHRHEIRVGHFTGEDLSLERGLANNPSYIEQSMYYTQLSRWLDHFPMTSFHVLIFEELFADAPTALRGVFEFLGVDGDFRPAQLGEKINEGRIPRSAALEGGLKRAVLGLRNSGLGWTVDAFKRAGLGRMVRAGNTRSDPEPAAAMPREIRLRLQELFRDENEKLARLLGRDLSVWSA